MGKYLELLDRAARERGRDRSDQSDISPPRHNWATTRFGRICRFGRSAEAAGRKTTWNADEEERAGVVEFEGGAPYAWAEAVALLDPKEPPGDVPPRRWLRFIDDTGRFLEGVWAERAVALGWGPLDLYGCDRERPFARVDHLGLLWLLNGGTIVELHRDRAVIETTGGARQTYRRRPVEAGRIVLAWELSL
jgi:hypothetical protein